jgi:hypothetical protein
MINILICYETVADTGAPITGDIYFEVSEVTLRALDDCRAKIRVTVAKGLSLRKGAKIIFRSVTRLDPEPAGCAKCDRGDGQLGRAEWCPESKDAKPASSPPCRRCGGMGWVPSKGDGDTDPCPACLHPDLA